MDLKPKGGGVSFGKNVVLCTIPYGAFVPRGGGGVSSDPPPGYGPVMYTYTIISSLPRR